MLTTEYIFHWLNDLLDEAVYHGEEEFCCPIDSGAYNEYLEAG